MYTNTYYMFDGSIPVDVTTHNHESDGTTTVKIDQLSLLKNETRYTLVQVNINLHPHQLEQLFDAIEPEVARIRAKRDERDTALAEAWAHEQELAPFSE